MRRPAILPLLPVGDAWPRLAQVNEAFFPSLSALRPLPTGAFLAVWGKDEPEG
jgi:hypothetical protein